MVRPLTGLQQSRLKLDLPMVVQIIAVEQSGPAQRAGLREGDIVISLDGHKISTIDEIHQLLNKKPPGTPVHIDVLRRGVLIELDIVLGELT